jgi:hypothetical protein
MRLFKGTFIAIVVTFVASAFADEVAVFPVQGVNTDKSFSDAFGMILAHRYTTVSGRNVLTPAKAGRAIESDSNLAKAAAKLGVSEYIETEAVGLYLSRHEEMQTVIDSSSGTKVFVNVKSRDNDNNEKSDQKLLDDSKTIVTVTRRDRSGAQIYRVEMTLLTYGDIEESCDRIAQALWRRVPLDQTRSMTNITRREGMGSNKTFAMKHKGVKMAAIFPLGYKAEKYSSIVGIGFDMRFEAEKYFLEFGVGPRIPTAMLDSTTYQYGGVAFDIGANYYIRPDNVGVYIGGGLVPLLNFFGTSSSLDGSPFQFGLAPYVQIGMVLPRQSRAQFFADLRISQHLMALKSSYTYTESVYDSTYNYYNYTTKTVEVTDRPFEIGFDFGILF